MSGDAAASADRLARRIEAEGLELVRLAWCDLHGILRGKTLTVPAALKALRSGVGMVSTLMLKDTSDRTAYKVFEAGMGRELPGFEFASNLVLRPDAQSFRVLPWADATGWLRCDPHFEDGRQVPLDTRHQLVLALQALAQEGLGLVCGLEIEFHIYRLRETGARADLDPRAAAWPGPAPEVDLVHPGYQLLSEDCFDQAEAPLRIVQRTAQALGLPLASLEIELGPSQVEAVFEPTDALTAADNMVLFRSAVRQALRRAGYHATFMCRPPFDAIMSSGWHLHQSLVRLDDGRNVLMPEAPATGTGPDDAAYTLSDIGCRYLAGLLAHARGMTALSTPTINGFGRFRPNALAPQAILWGRDNRGAMLRVIGGAGDKATRIENRLGEPAANPYLYMAAQIHAGLSGLRQGLRPGPATAAPYAAAGGEGGGEGAPAIPDNLGDALRALRDDAAMREGFGPDFIDYFTRVKTQELQRHAAAEDKLEFDRREYFARL